MNKSALWFLTVVIVFARCSAESIPAINKTSGFAVPHSFQAGEHDKQKNLGNGEAPHEEREPFAIESLVSSLKIAEESLPGTVHAVNMVDVPQIKESSKALAIHKTTMMDVSEIKERNEVLATRMETLGIDINSVVLVTEALKSRLERFFSVNNLEWMVLGKVYFGKDKSSTDYRVVHSEELFRELNIEIIDNKEIKKWIARLDNFRVASGNVFGKMLWLLQHHNDLHLHLADAAKMAFGSEYLNRLKLPSSGQILDAVGEQNVDKDLLESFLRKDKDIRKRIAPIADRRFAIESFTSSVKTADESLPRTEHAATMMDVSEIKERNEVLATRMETLGIDINSVVLVTEALKSKREEYFSLNNLEWMVLGKVYFQKDKRSTEYRVLQAKQMFRELNMEIIDKKEIKKWIARLHNFHVATGHVFGKMVWLLQHHNEFHLHLADAAKMAFGSEYLNRIELPSSGQILKAVGEQNVDKDLLECVLRQDEDIRKRIAPIADRRFAIESFTSSVKTADESLPRTEHAATMMDVSEIKERNNVLATRMETLGIDIDGVVLFTEALNSKLERFFSLNNLEWMVLGKVYFEKDGSSTGYETLRSKNLFKQLNMEIINNEEIKEWVARIEGFNVGAENVFGKMLWLIQNHNELNLHVADAAKMAFGWEYLNRIKLPSSDQILKAVGEQSVDQDLLESFLRQDRKRKAPKVDRGRFDIESLTSSVKTADESLPRTEHAATMIDVSEIKERNQVLATRLEKLGIDIGGVVFVTEALASEFGRYFSRNNLGWMILGKVYFKKAGSNTDYKSLSAKELFKELKMEIIDNEEITNWITRLFGFGVGARIVFGKVLWLLQHHDELNLDLADAAKMAFGSEYLNIIKLPSSDQIFQAVGKQNVDKDLVESILRQDKDSRKPKTPNPDRRFDIESFTSSVTTADESLPRTKHEATMMDVSEIKERNQVLATQLEKLGIDIGGVVFVTEALESEFGGFFSRKNLGWMVLGKVYFKKAGSNTGYSNLPLKELFKELKMKIIDNEEIKKWTARFNSFDVKAENVFGKMLWLKQDQNQLNLDLADAAKMAFGSEYLETRELPFSNEVLKALTEHNVDKDVTESLIPQDKDSTMTDIAVDKLLETIRNYIDEEVHEQPNKKSKLA